MFSGAHRDWIARAAETVAPGSTIFLDASEPSFILAGALTRRPIRDLTVVTNSLMISGGDLELPATVLVCPGRVNQRRHAIDGPLTVAFLMRQRLDTAFVWDSDPVTTAVRSIATRIVDLGRWETDGVER